MSTETFGQMLRRLRIGAGMSQNELARRASVNCALVNRLEAEKRTRKDHRPSVPGRRIVLEFARVLGISQAETDRFLVAAGHAPQADWQTRAEAAEAKLDIIRQTFDLTPDVLIFPRRRHG